MTDRLVNGSPLRAMLWLHTRERIGQVGRRTHLLTAGAGLLVAILAGSRLLVQTSRWLELPITDINLRLWFVMLTSWSSIAVMSALFTLQTALHRHDIGMLLPLPMDHASRWRLMLLRTASHFGPMLLSGVLITAFALSRFGLAWAITFLLWLPAALCLGVLATLHIAWLAGNGIPRKRSIAVTIAIPATIAVLFALMSHTHGHALAPVAMIPDAILIPVLVVGPGARRLGRWYTSLAQERFHAPSTARDFLGPISAWLGALLSRYRSPWAAIALKELRAQARDVFLIIRFALVAGAIPLYAVTHDLLPLQRFEASALIPAYALILGIYSVIETTPSPFGGEGNRLTLALLCPVSSRSLIAGKALAIIAPLLLQTWVIVLLLSVWSGTGVRTVLWTSIATSLAAASIGMITTCLSVRDIDLSTPVEGTSQALIVEHVPNRPVRLLIIVVSLMLGAGTALAIITLPVPMSLSIIAVCGLLLVGVAFRDANSQLNRLLNA